MFACMSNTVLVIKEIKAADISRPLTTVEISVFRDVLRSKLVCSQMNTQMMIREK